MSPCKIVPATATEEQLVAARDWSRAKYGKPIGNDAANGCYEAMLSAAPAFTLTEEMRAGMRAEILLRVGHAANGKGWYVARGTSRISYYEAQPEAEDACIEMQARAAWDYVLGVIAGEGERG